MKDEIVMLRAERMIREPSRVSVGEILFEADCPVHWHDYFTLDLILSGEGYNVTNGVPGVIRGGDIYYVRPTDIHLIRSEPGDPLHIMTVRFAEEAVPQEYRAMLRRQSAVWHPEEAEFSEMLSHARSIGTYCEKKAEDDGQTSLLIRAERLHLELMLITCALFSENQEEKQTAEADSEPVSAALGYLDLHFLENPDVRTTASAAGLSPAYFSSLFKKTLGCSYVEYLTHRKLSYACSLLTAGVPVSEVCFSSGFGSLSNFNRVFKEKIGVPPGKYSGDTEKNERILRSENL